MPQKYFLFHGKDWVTEYEKEYLPRWHRIQCAAESMDKLKNRLNVRQCEVVQQQKDIEQNKKSIKNANLPRLKEDIRQLQKILEIHEELASTTDNKEDSKARDTLMERTKVKIERKKVLIKEISESPDKILPAAKAAQIFIPKQEEQLKKLQQKANDLNKELVSKMAQLENDRVYVQFFQSALSKHIASVLDKIFKIPMLETPRPSAHKR
jgi:chromosome segregation ATPase